MGAVVIPLWDQFVLKMKKVNKTKEEKSDSSIHLKWNEEIKICLQRERKWRHESKSEHHGNQSSI